MGAPSASRRRFWWQTQPATGLDDAAAAELEALGAQPRRQQLAD